MSWQRDMVSAARALTGGRRDACAGQLPQTGRSRPYRERASEHIANQRAPGVRPAAGSAL